MITSTEKNNIALAKILGINIGQLYFLKRLTTGVLKECFEMYKDKLIHITDKHNIDTLAYLEYITIDSNAKHQKDMFCINPKISDKIYSSNCDFFRDLLEIYPERISNGTIDFNAISCDIEEICVIYGRKINNSPEIHKTVKKELEYQIKNDLIKIGIEKWVRSESWRVKRKSNSEEKEVNMYKFG